MNFQIFDPHRLTLAAPWTSAVSRTLKCMKKSVVRELPTAIKSWPDIGINRSQVLNKVICWENRFRAPKARGYTWCGTWTRLSVLIVFFCRILRLCRRALHIWNEIFLFYLTPKRRGNRCSVPFSRKVQRLNFHLKKNRGQSEQIEGSNNSSDDPS